MEWLTYDSEGGQPVATIGISGIHRIQITNQKLSVSNVHINNDTVKALVLLPPILQNLQCCNENDSSSVVAVKNKQNLRFSASLQTFLLAVIVLHLLLLFSEPMICTTRDYAS